VPPRTSCASASRAATADVRPFARGLTTAAAPADAAPVSDLEKLIEEFRPSQTLEKDLVGARHEVVVAETPFYRAWLPSAITVLGLMLALMGLMLNQSLPTSMVVPAAIVLTVTAALLLALVGALLRDTRQRDRALAAAQLKVLVIEALIAGRI
jgi:hypothetical protein